MSFQQGLSGLNAAAKNLDVIGNNVANANTVGYKQSSAVFGDVFANSLAGAGSTNVGIGTQVLGVDQQFNEGNITTTSNPLDVAINGKGFFRLDENGAISYSRNGQFQLDKNGYITNASGAKLTGYQALNGVVVPGVLGDLQVASADLAPKATASAGVGVNLSSADAVLPLAGFNPADPTTYDESTGMTVYDSLGQSHAMTLYFNKTAANTWGVNVYVDGAPANGAGVSTLSFNADGSLAGATNLAKSITLTNGAASPQTVNLDFSAVTQFGSPFGVNALNQDGYASGQLSSFSVGSDGSVLGRYTNGQSQTLGQVALANFTAPEGLQPLGQNMWGETADSGPPLVGVPGSSSLGALQSSAVEDSNVDLTAQLVNMITAQRVYQANAQSIKTEDQIMQTLVSL